MEFRVISEWSQGCDLKSTMLATSPCQARQAAQHASSCMTRTGTSFVNGLCFFPPLLDDWLCVQHGLEPGCLSVLSLAREGRFPGFLIKLLTRVGSPDTFLPAFSLTVAPVALPWRNTLFIRGPSRPQMGESLSPGKRFPAAPPRSRAAVKGAVRTCPAALRGVGGHIRLLPGRQSPLPKFPYETQRNVPPSTGGVYNL